jgi:hypothetical protein
MTAFLASDSGQLLQLFTRYNEDLWPLHVVMYVLAITLVVLIIARPGSGTDRIVTFTLAALWLWMGLVFQGIYVLDVNATAGVVYAVLFAIGAALFVKAGIRRTLRFRPANGVSGWLGWTALGFALLVYPVIGAMSGHGYPEAPLFGMAPCPTTIATFGLLLLAAPPIPHRVLIVPGVWALLAPAAAIEQGVNEDVALLITGIVTVILVLVRDHRIRRQKGGEHGNARPSGTTDRRHDVARQPSPSA